MSLPRKAHKWRLLELEETIAPAQDHSLWRVDVLEQHKSVTSKPRRVDRGIRHSHDKDAQAHGCAGHNCTRKQGGLFGISLYSSVAERQSCKLKVLGSIPSGGSCARWQESRAQKRTHKHRAPNEKNTHFDTLLGETPTETMQSNDALNILFSSKCKHHRTVTGVVGGRGRGRNPLRLKDDARPCRGKPEGNKAQWLKRVSKCFEPGRALVWR